MLLVIESREDLMPVPPEDNPRSTECALRHMGWPFPVDGAHAVRRPLPQRARRAVATPAPAPRVANMPSTPVPVIYTAPAAPAVHAAPAAPVMYAAPAAGLPTPMRLPVPLPRAAEPRRPRRASADTVYVLDFAEAH